jgi:hypothetical protein
MAIYKYSFDGYINGEACGWIFDEKTPGRRVSVGIFFNGELLTVGRADIYREDLMSAGIGDGVCSFRLPFDESLSGSIEVKTLPDDFLLRGSEKQNTVSDYFTCSLLNNFNFHNYQQFDNSKTVESSDSYFKFSHRLNKAFSNCVNGNDVKYTKHMEWVFTRDRQGSSNFFDFKNYHELENIIWYVFDYKSKSKMHDKLDEWILCPLYPSVRGMECYTTAYSWWLHKKGIKINIFTEEHMSNFLYFIGDLIKTNTAVTANILPSVMLKKDNRSVRLNGYNLPKLTAYGRLKHSASYSEIYDLSVPLNYLGYLFDTALHFNSLELDLMGDEYSEFFCEQILVGEEKTTRFSYLVWTLQMKALKNNSSNSKLSNTNEINIWFKHKWLKKHPQHVKFLSNDILLENEKSISPACYVVAFWDNEHGLTKNALMSVDALLNISVSVIKIYPDGKVYEIAESNKSALENDPVKLNRDIVLVHLNADKIPEVLANISTQVDLDNAYIIGYFLWELETVPKCHELGISLVDEIWVPTKFVYDIYAPYAPERIRLVGKAIDVPKFDSPDRKKFDISIDKSAFLITYDFNSGIERKNPLATVKAFVLAFPENKDVQLIIKTTPYQSNHWGDPFNQWAQIQKIANEDDRITVIDEFLDQDEFFELIACVDVVISSHRAEGFGYLPAYGLLYDKKVIATGYSGVTDFSEHPNMIMVDYTLVGLPNGKFIYQVPGAMWAEIDVNNLSKMMIDAVETITKKYSNDDKLKSIEFGKYYSNARLSKTYREAFSDLGIADSL